MLAWMIILTVALVAAIIFDVYAAKEICCLRTELHKLLNCNPYSSISHGHTVYRSSVIKEVPDAYDSTPEFVKGIKDMLEDIESLHKMENRMDELENDIRNLKEKDDAAE